MTEQFCIGVLPSKKTKELVNQLQSHTNNKGTGEELGYFIKGLSKIDPSFEKLKISQCKGENYIVLWSDPPYLTPIVGLTVKDDSIKEVPLRELDERIKYKVSLSDYVEIVALGKE